MTFKGEEMTMNKKITYEPLHKDEIPDEVDESLFDADEFLESEEMKLELTKKKSLDLKAQTL